MNEVYVANFSNSFVRQDMLSWPYYRIEFHLLVSINIDDKLFHGLNCKHNLGSRKRENTGEKIKRAENVIRTCCFSHHFDGKDFP